MSATETQTVKSKVEQVDINLDEIFNAAPSGADMIQDNKVKPKNIFSGLTEKADLSFADPDTTDVDDLDAKVEESKVEESTEEKKEEVKAESKPEEANEILDSLDDVDEEVETKKEEKRGRKSISGISDVFTKLIKEDKIVPFDDDKALEEYTAKDWEELIQANLDEKANQVRRETPKQFFQSLPQELQIAAKYVADGGKDLKGMFATLSQVEQHKQLDIKKSGDQEKIITEYLSATGYGTAEDIQEEIEIWKDLGKLESQASKFKPKLDKMQEKVVAQKLQEQELKKKQQENASQEYMKNVYETLKEGKLGDLKVDRKTQAMLYNGLVQPNYPSVSGTNTNLLGHLLEKYQFVEPNYGLISEALWLLQDPVAYKAKIMDKGAQKSVEKTVRKLKSEQTNAGGSSLGVQSRDEESKRSSKRKIQRPTNIFKRI
jgi:hypothetical protein|tara:strand:+ start:418 stop:1716 length:1299 start_codon:yes stop_codon:yes gene_type:complete